MVELLGDGTTAVHGGWGFKRTEVYHQPARVLRRRHRNRTRPRRLDSESLFIVYTFFSLVVHSLRSGFLSLLALRSIRFLWYLPILDPVVTIPLAITSSSINQSFA